MKVFALSTRDKPQKIIRLSKISRFSTKRDSCQEIVVIYERVLYKKVPIVKVCVDCKIVKKIQI